MRVMKSASTRWDNTFPAIGRGVKAYDADCMLVLVKAAPLSVAPKHKHPEKQYGFVIKGSATFKTKDGDRKLVAGDSYILGSNEEHEVAFGPEKEQLFLDVFVPARKDLMKLGDQKTRS